MSDFRRPATRHASRGVAAPELSRLAEVPACSINDAGCRPLNRAYDSCLNSVDLSKPAPRRARSLDLVSASASDLIVQQRVGWNKGFDRRLAFNRVESYLSALHARCIYGDYPEYYIHTLCTSAMNATAPLKLCDDPRERSDISMARGKVIGDFRPRGQSTALCPCFVRAVVLLLTWKVAARSRAINVLPCKSHSSL